MGLSGAKPAVIPLELNQKLTSLEYDKGIGSQGLNPLIDATSYQKFIRKLLYLTVTRPDISYAVQVLCQFMQTTKRSHKDNATRVAKYLKQEPDWAACPMSRRSVSGYLVKLEIL
ncbi:uncharacterized mitochondrial protein AtMg00810-like [Nicotiana sylvestris]|uniref:Uncharacterized mitochondrial protein AtMg00810-like n=1 Tax=Nicotiana tabacum TaxID=4097 RepID=A0A1S4AYW9_TOBAC|nr:PREDICTED: uncharacterized mitochondrial protein AtMg00810-like [Nicotiana tabacum]